MSRWTLELPEPLLLDMNSHASERLWWGFEGDESLATVLSSCQVMARRFCSILSAHT